MPLSPLSGLHMNFANSRLFTRCAALFLAVLTLVGPGSAVLARSISGSRPVIAGSEGDVDAIKTVFDYTLTPAQTAGEGEDNAPAVAAGQALPAVAQRRRPRLLLHDASNDAWALCRTAD